MLGTRGVPAAHGGFETAVENIGLDLVDRGWRVVVYCQDDDPGAVLRTDVWKGIERVHVPSGRDDTIGTVVFDRDAVRHAAEEASVDGSVCVTFGYNTAMLNVLLRAKKVPNIINMDGIEWKRARWSGPEKAFLYAQERAACRLGNHLIADHPEIRKHLATRVPDRKITTIAYGAPTVLDAPERVLVDYDLTSGGYLTLIARPVPENSILEVIRAFSSRRWGKKLVVLGNYDRAVEFQRSVLEAASDEVIFLGAIYNADVVQALRFHSLAYVHGHQVGGTNPSLVEALGCANPVIAHDNKYNRWVAGDAGLYFADESELVGALARVIDDASLATTLSDAARSRHEEEFTWSHITDQYESLIRSFLPASGPSLAAQRSADDSRSFAGARPR